MKNLTNTYSNPKQAVLPLFIQDYLDICDPVLTFDRFMGEIDLEKYLKEITKHEVGRLRYNPVSMLKTILFGFMTNGYVSLRELEDSCKVNLRFMYLMDHKAPSYRTFGYFINEIRVSKDTLTFIDFCLYLENLTRIDFRIGYLENLQNASLVFFILIMPVYLVSLGHNLYKFHNKQMKIKSAA